jgi:type VI secretion system protein ImpJ
MLLMPQHFQQSDLRNEALLQYSSVVSNPFCWGVRWVKWDTRLLAAGVLRLLDLEAVMPDGLPIRYSRTNQPPLEIDLSTHIDQTRFGEVTVYVAVAGTATADQNGGHCSRTEAYDGPLVEDANTRQSGVRIPRLRVRVMLLAGDEPQSKYVSFQLVKLRFQDGAAHVTDFVPPMIAVSLDSPLGAMCSRLAGRIREKATTLSDRFLTLEDKLRLHSLSAGLPAFEAILGTGTSHPWPLYLSLCGLAGQLAMLGTVMIPPAFPPYRHTDLRSTFAAVVDYASRMIAEGVPEIYAAHPFEFQDGGFQRVFEGEWAAKRLIFGLRAPAGISEREMIAWAQQSLIASESLIPSLKHKRLLGPDREFTERDGELVPARGVVLVHLQFDPQFIRPGELLRIVGPAERGLGFRPSEVVLYVSGPRT